jgi:Phage integrase, N-terminal SAM-like domain
LLDHVRDVLRVNHYSTRTEEAYIGWIRRYILYHNKKHPREMGALEVGLYLTHLAVGEKVSTNTQKQPLNTLGEGSIWRSQTAATVGANRTATTVRSFW